MTPNQIAKSDSEHAHQTALFAYCAFAAMRGFAIADMWCRGEEIPAPPLEELFDAGRKLPMLDWFHAIPNGGSRGDTANSRAIRGGALKAEGVRTGVADCFLPVPVLATIELQPMFGDSLPFNGSVLCGLYIEMKKPSEKPVRDTSKGGVSDAQKEFGEFVRKNGFAWIVCYSWSDAVKAIQTYLGYSNGT